MGSGSGPPVDRWEPATPGKRLVGAVIDAGTGLDRMLWGGIVSVAAGLVLALGASVRRVRGRP